MIGIRIPDDWKGTVMAATRRGILAGSVLAAAACTVSAASAAEGPFQHGVASGDPLPDAVVIWTRISPPEGAPRLAEVLWDVAEDEGFARIIRSGRAETGVARDFTVKVDVTGLTPGQRYFYRFRSGAHLSGTGITRTAPAREADVAALRLAVVSCSNHPAGYFNVYRAIAVRGDVDLVLHLGDYIYEYGASGYATQFGRQVGRVPDPPHEIVSLDDYRRRYAQYRSDPDLQAAHACAPWLVTWDDHEFTNDAWMAGAENHTEATEGPWSARKGVALQAYYEWMPLRDPAPGGSFEAINRAFDWGQLASITMLETRILGRAQQLDPAAALAGLTPGSEAFMAALAGLNRAMADPERQLLGPAQESWLAGRFAADAGRQVRWNLLGNQIIMARVPAPDFRGGLPQDVITRLVQALPQAEGYMDLAQLGLPLNLDAWDGYPAARERLYAAAKAAGVRLVTLTGDTHSSWANRLVDAGGELRGVEFGCSSVTSPDFADTFNALGLDGSLIGPLIASGAPDVIEHHEGQRGFVLLDVTPEAVRADFIAISTVFARDFTASRRSTWRWDGGAAGLVAAGS